MWVLILQFDGKNPWQRSRSKCQHSAAVEERGRGRRSISLRWQRWQVARVLAPVTRVSSMAGKSTRFIGVSI